MNATPHRIEAATPAGPPVPPPARSTGLLRQSFIIVLAVNSGAVDAIGFISLGGAFSSVMTGNMVLLGISVGHADVGLARNVGVALACFVAGCALGARVAGRPAPHDGVWPAPVRTALGIELLLMIAVFVGWTASGSHRATGTQLVLLGGYAAALGLQSSAMQRFGVAGLSTTYLTGTLTSVVSSLVRREPVNQIGRSATVLAGLVTGALLGGLLARHVGAAAALLPVLLVTVVVATPPIVWRHHS